MVSNAERKSFVVLGPDRTYYEVRLVRGIDRPIRWLTAGAGGAGLVIMALVYAVRWARWLAGERSWQVRVTRHPTLKGDDQTSQVVAETEQLGRAAAHDRALSMQDAIHRGDFQR